MLSNPYYSRITFICAAVTAGLTESVQRLKGSNPTTGLNNCYINIVSIAGTSQNHFLASNKMV